MSRPDELRDRNFYCYGQIERCKCLDIPALVDGFLFKLQGKGPDLVRVGLQVGLQIVVDYKTNQAPSLHFRPDALAILHSANASIDIDTYP